MNNHFNKLELTSFVTEDVNEEKRKLIENHIINCSECSKIVNQLKSDQNDFLNKFPQPINTTDTKNNIISTSKSYWTKIIPIAALLIFAVTINFYYNHSVKNSTMLVAHGLKGEMGATLVVLNENNSIEERTNHIYYPQEKIQIKYSASDFLNLISFSIDNKGIIYTYCPEESDSSFIIQNGSGIPLPNSIVLDNYLGDELFITVFSKNRVSVPYIKKEIENAFLETKNLNKFNLDLGKNFYISQTLIKKQAK